MRISNPPFASLPKRIRGFLLSITWRCISLLICSSGNPAPKTSVTDFARTICAAFDEVQQMSEAAFTSAVVFT